MRSQKLPPQMIFDFKQDYLPPPLSFPAYVHEQNAAMQRFAAAWNEHYAGQPGRQIKPPVHPLCAGAGDVGRFTAPAT